MEAAMSESGSTSQPGGGGPTAPDLSLPPLKVPGTPAAVPTIRSVATAQPTAVVPPTPETFPVNGGDSSNGDQPHASGHKIAAVVAAVVVVLGAAVGEFLVLASGGPTGFTSPSAANAALFAAARTAGSFHYAGTSTGSEGGNVLAGTASGDAGRTEGIQFLTTNVANYEVIVVNSVAYMKPDLGALENSFGYTASEAAPYANRWIELTPADAPYKGVADGVTTGSDWGDASQSPSDNLPHTPQSVSAVSTANGRSVQRVTYSMSGTGPSSVGGHYSGTESLVFAAGSHHLPYSLVEHLTGTANGQPATNDATAAFSNWGEAVHVAIPADPIAFSSLPPPPTTA
jgi:hypothetical protein